MTILPGASGRGFADAVALLPPVARARVRLLTAWWRGCRTMLGAADLPDDVARLIRVRQLTARAVAGEPTGVAGFDALAIVAAECDYSRAQVDDAMTGLMLAATGWRPATQIELLGYAYHAGGAPGALVMRALGIAEDDGELLDCASDGGVALVLSRIAGDLARAAPNGVMVPRDWLAQAGVDADQLSLPSHHALRQPFAARCRALAAPYAISARYGAAHLPFRCRWAASTLLAQCPAGGPGRSIDRLTGLIHALRHGPEDAHVPLTRGTLARAISPVKWLLSVDAAVETAVPAH